MITNGNTSWKLNYNKGANDGPVEELRTLIRESERRTERPPEERNDDKKENCSHHADMTRGRYRDIGYDTEIEAAERSL